MRRINRPGLVGSAALGLVASIVAFVVLGGTQAPAVLHPVSGVDFLVTLSVIGMCGSAGLLATWFGRWEDANAEKSRVQASGVPGLFGMAGQWGAILLILWTLFQLACTATVRLGWTDGDVNRTPLNGEYLAADTIRCSPNGSRWVLCSGYSAVAYDPITGRLLPLVQSFDRQIEKSGFSTDGSVFVVVFDKDYDDPADRPRVQRWWSQSWSELPANNQVPRDYELFDPALHPDRLRQLNQIDGQVLLQRDDGQTVQTLLKIPLNGGTLQSCGFTHDGRRFYVASVDATLKIEVWDCESLTLQQTVERSVTDRFSCGVASDLSQAILCSPTDIRVWRLSPTVPSEAP